MLEHDIQHLLKGRGETPASAVPAGKRGLTLQEVERNAFLQTYLRTGKNKARTARELGISERSVYNLLGRHGLKQSSNRTYQGESRSITQAPSFFR